MTKTKSGALSINQIGQISISITDVDRAVAFYRDTLGIPFLFQVPGSPAMAFFDCDGTRLMLTQSESQSAAGTSIIYFRTESAHAAAEALTASGIELESEPHIIHQTDSYTLWMAFFRDPDGNLMAVMSEEGELMG